MQTIKLTMPQGVQAPRAFSTTVDHAPFCTGLQYHTNGLKPMTPKSLKLQSLAQFPLYRRFASLKENKIKDLFQIHAIVDQSSQKGFSDPKAYLRKFRPLIIESRKLATCNIKANGKVIITHLSDAKFAYTQKMSFISALKKKGLFKKPSFYA